jgi:nitrous oxidase accessory protein NosD
VIKSVIADNGYYGIGVAGASQAHIADSQISRNYIGFINYGTGEATILNSDISANRTQGISLKVEGKLTLQGSNVEGNGTRSDCADGWMCNGIVLRENTELTLLDSAIIDNADWGLTVERRECGRSEGSLLFTGTVTFEGENTIKGNNQSGNQDGLGNPGEHPWSGPEVPDGQVCVP